MNKKFLFATMVFGACALHACQNSNRTSNDPDSLTTSMVDSTKAAMQDTAGINDNDTASFIHKAAVGGMMEVELGEMAQQKASSTQVKDFGALMVKDHSKANTELKSVAARKNLSLPTTYPASIQTHIDEMKKMSGAAFDRHYMSMMVEDHAKDINLFREASKDTDTAVSKFAAKTLPVLVGHQQKAKEVMASLK